MQLTILQDKSQIESERSYSTLSEIDTTNDITVIKQKISELDVKYKQKGQRLEQQKLYIGN